MAANITVSSVDVQNCQYSGTTIELRIWPDQSFIAADGTVIQAPDDLGNPRSFYKSVSCSLASGTLTIDEFDIHSTTDANENQNARYWAYFYVDGVQRDRFLPDSLQNGFYVRPTYSTGTTTTWALIETDNNPTRRIRDDNRTYTQDQISTLINTAVSVGNAATTSTIGRIKVSVDPVSALSPIAVGDNDSRLGHVTPKQYGALGDDTGATITSDDVTTHAVGTRYPWAGSYTVGVDTKDYVGLQEAIYAAFYSGTTTPNGSSARLNKPLFIPPGTYLVNKAPTLTTVRGGRIYGAGRLSTAIESTSADIPAFQTNGCWFTHFEGIAFQAAASSTVGVFELDGNFDGTHTQGVQGNTFKDCYFYGGTLAAYGLAITRRGGSSGQGSENILLNCHFEGATTACYYQNGFNALNNSIIGGNFQSYSKHGAQLISGSASFYGTGFQSTYRYTQVLNSGYDIDASTGGAYDRLIVDGCRTESLRFFNGAFSQHAIIRGLRQYPSTLTWSAALAVSLNAVVTGLTAAGYKKLYRVTTAGTTGGTEPTWPESGTVTDGTVTWTETDLTSVVLVAGSISDSFLDSGGQLSAGRETHVIHNRFTRADFTTSKTAVYDANYRIDPSTGGVTALQMGRRAGTVTLSSGSAAVTFASAEPDALYYITLGGGANETFRWGNLSASGFTIFSSNASSTATVHWRVDR